MDYSRSLLKFLKVVLVFTSIYWCILLSVLLFLILEQGSTSQSTSDRDADANSRAGPLMIGLIIVLSVCGGALVILLAAFHLLSQQYKESGKFKSINRKYPRKNVLAYFSYNYT
jgi:UDP-N-acetylmuramyl pentapeptide phosphotransferase/UDP-N-acetylglucosamine-1-phosphate transferase